VLIAICMIVTVALAVMGTAGTALLSSYLINRNDAQLRSFAALAAKRPFPARPPPPRPSQRGNPPLPSAFLIEIVRADGSVERVVRAGFRGQHEAPAPRLAAVQLHPAARPFSVRAGSHIWRVIVKSLPGRRYAVIALSLDDVLPVVAQLELIELAAGLAALVLLMITSFWLVRASLAPLRGIEQTAASIAGGELSQRVPDYPLRTEVGRLSAALNTMLGRIEAAYRAREKGEQRAQNSEERMRRFVADASHELRTPLTSIQGFADFHAQQVEAADRAETSRLMNRIRAEALRMGDLVNDLLLLAHLDEQRKLEQLPVDLSSLAADAVHDFRRVQPGRRLGLQADDEPIIVNADEARLRQVIVNLLSNALQHTPPGTPVDVSVHREGNEAHLAVADQGPGMPERQADHVFERFYRADPARSRASGGSGLGLSIVAALVSAHGGRVGVDTEPGRGCVFHVWLPLAEFSATAAVPGPAFRPGDVPPPLTFFTEPGQLRFSGLGSPAVPVWLIAPCSLYGLGGVAPGAAGA
jgi:two-component system OmpR family sensor kinase